MISTESKKIQSERRKYFEGFCTDTVVGYILHDNTFSIDQKTQILEIAKQTARVRGYYRVTWEDFCDAIGTFRKTKRN